MGAGRFSFVPDILAGSDFLNVWRATATSPCSMFRLAVLAQRYGDVGEAVELPEANSRRAFNEAYGVVRKPLPHTNQVITALSDPPGPLSATLGRVIYHDGVGPQIVDHT
jgi:hypothetical protein